MSQIIKQLIQKLGSEKVLTEAAVKERYYHIWKMEEPLNALAVVLPKSTQDVADAMKICHEHNQSVIVHGGLTNLVGSTETTGNEVVIAMEKMNLIEELDEQSRTMTVQSGVILENIQNAATEKDLLFPMNFGAKGSAQIGGVISTNAGGLRVFRFGMTRNLVLGLEAVLADGTIISSLKKIIKDNSGYDLKQLFIGSEGTLGVITKAVLKLAEAPKSRISALVGINDFEKIPALLKFMDKGLAGTLSGFELIWQKTYETSTSAPNLAKPPVPHGYKYYVLMDSLGSQPESDSVIFKELVEAAFEDELILDAAFAENEFDTQWFWKIREDVHAFVSQANHDQHFDISIPIPLIGEIIDQIVEESALIPEVEVCYPFGHIADGNIHLVFGKSVHTPEVVHQINQVVYSKVQQVNGSVSAEHGIGLHKKKYLSLCRSAAEIEMMKTLKKALDPKGILNPGKVIDL